MPSVVATIQVKEDKIEAAKTFLKKLCADTLANESGTLTYVAHQRKDQPTTFVFYEKYESDAAFEIHGKNLRAAGASFADILAGPPDIQMLEEI
jgi:quinol monooxygenase YgiN